MRHRPGAAADFQAIDAGQHDVEDQRVPAAPLHLAQALGAVGAVQHFQLLVAQVQGEQVGDVNVVLDQQDASRLIHRGQILTGVNLIVRNFPVPRYHELFNSP
ncbi:hypothetical protein FQZ97_860470 [compost metagenome]